MIEINDIFALVEEALLSIRFENQKEHEFARVFGLWNDVEYLEEFFETHKKDLQSEFYREKLGFISVEEAVFRTIEEAETFQEYVKQVAEEGKKNEYETLHDLIFNPLRKNDSTINHQHSKAYGESQHSWLRLYAIRLAPNLYVVTGGTIKLTKKMQDRAHTQKELDKLEQVAAWLKEIGFEDETDYGYIEIKQ